MPFRYRPCSRCDHKRICREVDADDGMLEWLCEVCDDSTDPVDWPSTASDAHD